MHIINHIKNLRKQTVKSLHTKNRILQESLSQKRKILSQPSLLFPSLSFKKRAVVFDDMLHVVIIAVGGNRRQAARCQVAKQQTQLLYYMRQGVQRTYEFQIKISNLFPTLYKVCIIVKYQNPVPINDTIQAYYENKVNNGCVAWQLKSTITTVSS